jgi:hypothetical protein
MVVKGKNYSPKTAFFWALLKMVFKTCTHTGVHPRRCGTPNAKTPKRK